jgi:hypothetical protein
MHRAVLCLALLATLGLLTACQSEPREQVYQSRSTILVPRTAAGTSAVIDTAAAALQAEGCRITTRDDHSLAAEAGGRESIAIAISATDRTFKADGIVEGYDALDVTIDLSAHFQLPVAKHPSWQTAQDVSNQAERLRTLLIQRISP